MSFSPVSNLSLPALPVPSARPSSSWLDRSYGFLPVPGTEWSQDALASVWPPSKSFTGSPSPAGKAHRAWLRFLATSLSVFISTRLVHSPIFLAVSRFFTPLMFPSPQMSFSSFLFLYRDAQHHPVQTSFPVNSPRRSCSLLFLCSWRRALCALDSVSRFCLYHLPHFSHFFLDLVPGVVSGTLDVMLTKSFLNELGFC